MGTATVPVRAANMNINVNMNVNVNVNAFCVQDATLTSTTTNEWSRMAFRKPIKLNVLYGASMYTEIQMFNVAFVQSITILHEVAC